MRTILACLCLTLAACGTPQDYAVYSDHELCLSAGEAGSEAYAQCKAARKAALRQNVQYAPQNTYQPGKSELEQRRSEMYVGTGLWLMEMGRTRYYTLPSGDSGFMNSPMPGDYPAYPPQFHAPQRTYQGAQVPRTPNSLTSPPPSIPGQFR